MSGVALRCVEARSYDAFDYRLSKPYHITRQAWTVVENAGDLEYLLNHRGVLFRENPELGCRFYRCTTETNRAVHLPEGDRSFAAGEVIAADGPTSRVLREHRAFTPVPVVEVLSAHPNLRVLVVRNGGLGDILLTLPAIARLKHDFPDASVSYSTDPQRTRILSANPLITKVYGYPDAYSDAPFGYVLDLGYWAEMAPGIERYHRSDIFAHAFGYDQVADYGFDYQVLPHEREWAQGQIGDKPTVAVQVSGTINRRCPPAEWMATLLQRLRSEGYRLVIFGEHGGDQWDADLNLAGNSEMWRTFAILEQCVGVVAGDSGVLHAANALNRPVVGIFGPVAPQLRVRNQPLCRTVTANAAVGCEPCNDHQLHQCEGYPPCLVRINHDEVMAALQEVMADGGVLG